MMTMAPLWLFPKLCIERVSVPRMGVTPENLAPNGLKIMTKLG